MNQLNQPQSSTEMATSSGAVSVHHMGNMVHLYWEDGHVSRYNRYWLRDNCSTAGDKQTAIRSFALHQLACDVIIRSTWLDDENTLVVAWENETHLSRFPLSWLREHCPEQSSRLRKKRLPRHFDETLSTDNLLCHYRDLEFGNQLHLGLLNRLMDYGFALVSGVPQDEAGTEALSAYLGYLSEDHFGRIFHLVSEPDVWDLSQSTEALDPHCDDPFRYSPPGIRILHCLEAGGNDSGMSKIVDGFTVAELLRQQSPQAFELLAEVPVPFIRHLDNANIEHIDGAYLYAEAPIISLDREGEICGFRFHERSMATLDIDTDLMEPYYEALIQLSQLVNRDDLAFKHALQPGEAIIFDNHRVLHGRSSFKGAPGRRHLTLCQVNRDQVHSNLRRLLKRHVPGDAHRAIFPCGA